MTFGMSKKKILTIILVGYGFIPVTAFIANSIAGLFNINTDSPVYALVVWSVIGLFCVPFCFWIGNILPPEKKRIKRFFQTAPVYVWLLGVLTCIMQCL